MEPTFKSEQILASIFEVEELETRLENRWVSSPCLCICDCKTGEPFYEMGEGSNLN
jgi:hypothetical protein